MMTRISRFPTLVGIALVVVFALPIWFGPAQARATCGGDCNGDDEVTVDELVTMVNIALGNANVSTCPTGDVNQDNQITIDELIAAVNIALAGCVGDQTTISGAAVKGPVSGAHVVAFGVGPGGAKGAQIGSATTDDSGNFQMQVGNYSGPLMLEMTGGSFSDEATGTHMGMGATDMMTAGVPNVMAGSTLSGIQITPLTSMAQRMAEDMPGGMTQANITQSNSAMGSYFGVSDIVAVHPMDPTVPGSGASANRDERDHGMAIAAISEFASTMGMTTSSGMVTAMMNDASDGIMNGMMGGTPIDMGGMGGMMHGTMMPPDAGTSGMATAMTSFILSPQNKSGLTLQDMQLLINRLETSNGTIQ